MADLGHGSDAKRRRAEPALPARPRAPRDESEVRWLISYSDFMMQLVCLFILLYSVSTMDPAKASAVARVARNA